MNVFAITDVLIYGENSSFENLHLDISFSKGMEKGSAEFLRFGKVIVKNAEVDIIGPWRVNLNMSGGDLKGEIKHGAQLRYSGNARSVSVENARFALVEAITNHLLSLHNSVVKDNGRAHTRNFPTTESVKTKKGLKFFRRLSLGLTADDAWTFGTLSIVLAPAYRVLADLWAVSYLPAPSPSR